MQPEVVSNLAVESIRLALLLSAPLVGAAALVGLALNYLLVFIEARLTRWITARMFRAQPTGRFR